MRDRPELVSPDVATTTPLPVVVPGRPTASRLAWVDAAKGMSILLVLVHHLVMFLAPYGLVPPLMWTADSALSSLRMPLFFLASGLFLATALAAPWRTLLHKRVALFGYLYLLWALLLYGWFRLFPDVSGSLGGLATTPGQLVAQLVIPGSSTWFLYALALFSVLAKLARRVLPVVQLGVTGVLSVLASSGLLGIGSETWTLMARCLFFFLLGCYARPAVEALAARTGPVKAALAAVVCVAVAAVDVVLGLNGAPGVAFACNVAAVTFGVLLAALLARQRIARPLIVLGRHTLPVYLLNVFLIALVAEAVRGVRLPVVEQYLAPAVLAVLVTLAALGLHRLLCAVGAGALFALPSRLAHRPTG